ncbi:phosphatase PAP2 family protein [Candidatus Odyssella thessalonicensis]|uniref:phosphatase PAP2 family protein n=1 Tax=Candidatus Odyssella thessalonicensis TaxID=84647 RepID=UPI000225C0C8|nr:phosphatase PAP2 family protein [Candidatus Odyssella thessalonicensis]
MDILSTVFLQGTQFYTIVLIAVVGLVFIDRRIFMRALVITLFSMIVNACLKLIFKIPLKSHLGKGWYAFPSGHANTSTTFYGYLVSQFKNILVTLIGIIVIGGICWALIHNNFHDWSDVLAAVGVAVLLLTIFHFVERSRLFKDNFMLLALLITGVAVSLEQFLPSIVTHTAIPIGALFGISITTVLEKMFGYRGINPIVDFLIIMLGIIGLDILFTKLHLTNYTYQVMKFALISFWATYSPHILTQLRR